MPSYTRGGVDTRGPFGKNEFRRSTQDIKYQPYTVAASSVKAVTIDGHAGQKVFQPGVALAKITSGPEAGKVGPYSSDAVGVTDGRAVLANIVGVNSTFLPWQLLERDVEVSAAYEGSLVQAWCFEDTATGNVPLSNAAATAMQRGGAAGKGVDITWK